MKDPKILVVEKYLDSLRRQDLSDAPLAEDVCFQNPISGKGRGAEAMRSWLSGFLPALHELRIVQHVCEGEFVVTHWEADSDFGCVAILEKFRVRDGLITEAMAFLDPRPVFGN